MRRFLVILLVLGLAPGACALMLSYRVDPLQTVMPGVPVTIQVVGDVDALSFIIGNVAITGNFSNVATGTVNTMFGSIREPGTLRDGSVANVWITLMQGIGGVSSPKVPAGQVLATFTITPDQDSYGKSITIDDYVGNPYTGGMIRRTTYNGHDIDMSPLTVSVLIPEPMTIALVGLGGLMLGRRK